MEIPTNGVHIVEASHPKGFYVAEYDAEGLTTLPRWFATLAQAQAYAGSLLEQEGGCKLLLQ